MRISSLRQNLMQSLNNNPDNNNKFKIQKQFIYTKELLKRHFPFVNLNENLIKKLNINSRAYEKNFKLLWKNRNKDNSAFLKIEKKLNQKDIAIRKKLGIYTSTGKGTKKHKSGEVNE